MQLLPPFWKVNPPSARLVACDVNCPSLAQNLSFGRPMWSAYQGVSAEEMLEFARRKLFGGGSLFCQLPATNKRAVALAVATLLLDLNVNPLSEIASELIASNMV